MPQVGKVSVGVILYYAEEYGTAAHLCACGCGSKIQPPLMRPSGFFETMLVANTEPVGRQLAEALSLALLYQKRDVLWHGQWTEAEIKAGRRSEHQRRVAHLNRKSSKKKRSGFWNWMQDFFD